MWSRIWFAWRVWWWQLWLSSESMAILIIRDGGQFRFQLAKFVKGIETADEYHYEDMVLFVPKKQSWETLQGERLLGVVGNEVVSTPFSGSGVEVSGSLISKLVKGSVFDNQLEAVSGVGGFKLSLKWILVGVAVLAIGYVVWKYVLGGHLPGGSGGGVEPLPTPEAVMFWMRQSLSA